MKKRHLAALASLAAGAAVAAGLIAGPAGSTPSRGLAAQDCKTLNVLVWEGYADPSFIKPFEKANGVTVKATYISTEDQELAKMVGGGTKLFDVLTVSSDNRKQLVDAKVIKPLDTSKIPMYRSIFPFLKSTYQLNGKTWAVAQDWGVNPFVYSKKAFKTPPTSWKVMLDPKFKGQLAIWGDYSLIYVGAALLGYDKNPKQLFNLSSKQLDAIKAEMVKLKPQIRKVWSTGGDLIQLFANGEVQGSLGWNYIYQQLSIKKFPVGQVVFKDHGAHGWIDANGISSGIDADCEPLAYKFIDYMAQPKVGAQLAAVTGYAVAAPGATKFMKPDLIKSTSMDRPNAYIKGAIIKVDPADRKAYIKTADEIMAALG